MGFRQESNSSGLVESEILSSDARRIHVVNGVGYVNLYRQGNTGKAIELAKSALKIDPEFSQVETLPKNLWGDKIIADARKLLSQL